MSILIDSYSLVIPMAFALCAPSVLQLPNEQSGVWTGPGPTVTKTHFLDHLDGQDGRRNQKQREVTWSRSHSYWWQSWELSPSVLIPTSVCLYSILFRCCGNPCVSTWKLSTSVQKLRRTSLSNHPQVLWDIRALRASCLHTLYYWIPLKLLSEHTSVSYFTLQLNY